MKSKKPAAPDAKRGGRRGLEPMTKKPVKRYTVDGKPMTPDDLWRRMTISSI